MKKSIFFGMEVVGLPSTFLSSVARVGLSTVYCYPIKPTDSLTGDMPVDVNSISAVDASVAYKTMTHYVTLTPDKIDYVLPVKDRDSYEVNIPTYEGVEPSILVVSKGDNWKDAGGETWVIDAIEGEDITLRPQSGSVEDEKKIKSGDLSQYLKVDPNSVTIESLVDRAMITGNTKAVVESYLAQQ